MSAGLVLHVARFGRALRGRGVGVGLSDEADALEALALVDLGDREEVRRALRVALKVRRRDAAAFDELFGRWWGPRPDSRDAEPRAAAGGQLAPRAPLAPLAPRPDADQPAAGAGRAAHVSGIAGVAGMAGPSGWPATEPPPGPEIEVPAGEEPGYSPVALLRRKSFEECSAADLEAMERLIDRLVPRLATRPGRRRVPVRGTAHGEVDPRRSLRRLPAHGGELLALARRRRAIEHPRLVVLCDTSGSMDPHTRFLLAFVLALRRVARRTELFAFNTALVRLTPWLRDARGTRGAREARPAAEAVGAADGSVAAGAAGAIGGIDRVLRSLAEDVPGWSGGTRIGECLAEFAARWLGERVDGRTVVLILSDGLDRGDVGPLAAAMRAIRGRARRVLWLNPLAGDRRYEPTARAIAAALPYVDRLLPAHNLESLERLLPLLSV